MNSITKIVKENSECRTPIVVLKEDADGSVDRVVDVVKRVASSCDSYVEHVHANIDDELVSIGKRIDTAIINGDWLLITFGVRFTIPDFLRFVGRRLFTIMPDNDKRPNMELFRLWLCLDKTVQQPLVFKHVALQLDLRVIHQEKGNEVGSEHRMHSGPPLTQMSAQIKKPISASQSSVPPRPESSRRSAPAPVSKQQQSQSAVSRQYEEEIPLDDSACDDEAEFETAAINHSSHQTLSGLSTASASDPMAAAVEGGSTCSSRPTSTKVGALFHRRLELSAGRRPTSSGSRAAEIRNLRIQSAQLSRQVASVSASPKIMSARLLPSTNDVSPSVAHEPARPARDTANHASRPPSSHVTSPSEDSFQRTSSEVLQKLHCAMMRAFTYSEPNALRMQQLLLEFADSVFHDPSNPSNATTNSADSFVESRSMLPTHDFKRLVVDEVLKVDGDVTLRRGLWRSVDVLLEQMSCEQFAAAWSTLARIRCFLKHPHVSSPLAVLRDVTSPLTYVVYPYPSNGPLPSSLRRIDQHGPTAHVVTTALHVTRSVAVALQFLHDEGFVHRDLSAQQILDFGGNTYQLRITGRCKKIEPDGGSPAEGVATRWASPDALFTGRFHPEDDVWSLGILIWEVLTLCREIPYSDLPLKDEVAAALARGDVIRCPDAFKNHFIWTKIAAPCFNSRMRRPSLCSIIELIDQHMS